MAKYSWLLLADVWSSCSHLAVLSMKGARSAPATPFPILDILLLSIEEICRGAFRYARIRYEQNSQPSISHSDLNENHSHLRQGRPALWYCEYHNANIICDYDFCTGCVRSLLFRKRLSA